MAPCARIVLSYTQQLPNGINQAEVIEGLQPTVTLSGGQGSSAVLFLANLTIKTVNNANNNDANAFRFQLWLQRSTTSDFSANVSNIYRWEDATASGINGFPANTSPGIAHTTISYADTDLPNGTYYYRLVFQCARAANGQTIYCTDRTATLLQLKQ